MKVIAVTGTPGTGKTTLAKRIAKIHGFMYIDVNVLISLYNISEGVDRARKSKIIDVKKLQTIISKELRKLKRDKSVNGVVIDSHLSHYLSSKLVDLCVVTKCELGELEARLKKRRYSKSKVRENLDAEIFDICHVEATEKKHNIIVFDTSKRILNKDLEAIKRKW